MKRKTVFSCLPSLAVIALSIITNYVLAEDATKPEAPSPEDYKKYYRGELINVSPHHARKHMDDGQSILVDVRSNEEYLEAHIKGAKNIPVYKNRDLSDYDNVEAIVNAFKTLKDDNPKKEIIVYCYSRDCQSGNIVGDILATNNIYVKHLKCGWNGWVIDFNSWNHCHEIKGLNVRQYLEGSNIDEVLQTLGLPL